MVEERNQSRADAARQTKDLERERKRQERESKRAREKREERRCKFSFAREDLSLSRSSSTGKEYQFGMKMERNSIPMDERD